MVLVVIGLLAGVALPRLYDLARRFEVAAQKDNVLLALGNLPYRAYQTGQTISLGTKPSLSATDAAVDALEQLPLPPGWKIEVPQPIRYSFTGICSGGTLILLGPDGYQQPFKLTPPLCLPVATADASQP